MDKNIEIKTLITKLIKEELDNITNPSKEFTEEELNKIIKDKGYNPKWYRSHAGDDYNLVVYIGTQPSRMYPMGQDISLSKNMNGTPKSGLEKQLITDLDYFLSLGFEIKRVTSFGVTSDYLIYKIREGAEPIKVGSRFYTSSDEYTRSGRGKVNVVYEIKKALGDDKFECEVVVDELARGYGDKGKEGATSTWTKQQIINTDSLYNPK